MKDIKKIVNSLIAYGYETENLDDLVYDASFNVACNINNAGIEEQVRFLVQECDWDYKDIVEELRK